MVGRSVLLRTDNGENSEVGKMWTFAERCGHACNIDKIIHGVNRLLHAVDSIVIRSYYAAIACMLTSILTLRFSK